MAMKTKEEKIETVRQAASDLKTKAAQAGHDEPFVSWVIDPNGGLLVLDAPGPVDSSSAPALSWDSNRLLVFVFCETRRSFFQTTINF